jgi:peptide/nickel transport system substrate-binding protein
MTACAKLYRAVRAGVILAACVAIVTGPVAAADTLRVAVSEIPKSRGNPYGAIFTPSSFTWSAMFEAITHVDGKGALVPWIATGWVQTAPTSWRFTLRDDVYFSNGESLDATAVASAVAYLTSPQGRTETVARELPTLKRAVVVDPRTVDIETTRPNLFLPQELINLRLVAPRLWETVGPQEYSSLGVGSGPYKVDKWGPARITLSAHHRAWRKPRVPRLEIVSVPDGAARLQSLLAKQVDVALALGPDDKAAVEEAGLVFYSALEPGVSAIILNNVKDTPFRDVRVRQALNYGVNRERIVRQLLGNTTLLASQTAAHTASGFNPDLKPYPFDPERARALLREAGRPNGFTFTLELPSEGGSYHMVYQQIAADLAAVGISMVIRTVPTSQFLDQIQSGAWRGEAFQMAYFTGTYDALRPMRNQSCLWPNPWYCDRDIMPRITAALVETNLAKREAMVREIMAYNHANAQGLFLYENVASVAMRDAVTGFDYDGGFIDYAAIAVTP